MIQEAYRGGFPTSIWKNIQPIAKTSHLSVCSWFFSCCGEAYVKVTENFYYFLSVCSIAVPKSLIFISPLLFVKMFWGLRSLWAIFLLYKASYDFKINLSFYKAFLGSYPSSGIVRWPKSMSSQAITNIISFWLRGIILDMYILTILSDFTNCCRRAYCWHLWRVSKL